MDPLSYISRLSERNTQRSNISYELVAISVFVIIYVFIRVTETCIIPLIPEFFRTEISAFYRWFPVIIPIIVGFIYIKPKKNETSDNTLKRRMKDIIS